MKKILARVAGVAVCLAVGVGIPAYAVPGERSAVNLSDSGSIVNAYAPSGWVPWDGFNNTLSGCTWFRSQVSKNDGVPLSSLACFSSPEKPGYYWLYVREGVAFA